jgi:apolipoprotein N-acyltransferase
LRDAAGQGVAAFALGACAVAGFAPLDWWLAMVAALAGLFWLADCAAPRRAAFLGWTFGLGFFLVGVSWVYVSMHDVGGMPAMLAALAVLLFAAFLALYPALALWLAAALRRPHWTHRMLVLPAGWALTEWLRGWIFTGFPWLAIGYADAGGWLRGFAPIIGVYGVGFACAMLAAALGDLCRRAVTAGDAWPAWHDAAWVLLLGAGMLLPRFEWTNPQGAPVKVALLQGNIAQDLKFVEGRFESTLALYRHLIDSHPATLVVLPETALPRMLHAVPRDWLDALAAHARAAGSDIVVGVPLAESRERYFNSAISLGTSATGRYDKVHLVPFGEFIPFGFRWFVEAMNMPLGDFTRGTDAPRPLALGTQQVAVNICYEDLFGEEIIRQLPTATLLVNISNIAWFGDSLAPHQHLEISRMRALETGRPMLRATNTGMTAVIDSSGIVVQRLAPFTEGALTAQVQGRGGATPYVRFGNLPVIGACAALLAVAAWRRRAGRGQAPA